MSKLSEMFFLSITICMYGLLRQVHSNELRYGIDTFKGVPCAIRKETRVIETLLGMSLGDCKQACLEMNACLSMNYIRPFHVCQLLKKGNGPKNQLVTRGSCATYTVHRTIGQYCTIDSDCVENHSVCLHGNGAAGGLCFCDKLYRYVAAKLECVKVCDHLLDDFEEHLNIAFTNYNSLGRSHATLEVCKNKCLAQQECMSFEYSVSRSRCQMGRVSKEMLLDADPTAIWFGAKGVVVYSRLCGNN